MGNLSIFASALPRSLLTCLPCSVYAVPLPGLTEIQSTGKMTVCPIHKPPILLWRERCFAAYIFLPRLANLILLLSVQNAEIQCTEKIIVC